MQQLTQTFQKVAFYRVTRGNNERKYEFVFCGGGDTLLKTPKQTKLALWLCMRIFFVYIIRRQYCNYC